MSTSSFVPALAVFAFATSITPGPNNLMLLNAGVRHGWRSGLPTLVGVQTGFLSLLLACSAGLGAMFAAVPAAERVLAWCCALYLGWLALGNLRGSKLPPGEPLPTARPPGWWQAALLQLVNPKAWSMTIAGAAIAAESALPPASATLVLLAVFALVGLPCSATWLAGGAALQPLLRDPQRRRRFDCAMALLLVATAAWLVWPAEVGRAQGAGATLRDDRNVGPPYQRFADVAGVAVR